MISEPREVTVVVTNYNGGDVLPRTIATLRTVLGERTAVVVADDGSSDGSPERIRETFPDVRVVSPGRHTGRLNVVRNVGLRAVQTPLSFLIDNDILVTPDAVAELMRVLGSRDAILCCTPRLIDFDDENRIYSDGNYLHYLGLSGTSKRGRLVSELPAGTPRPTFGGGIMLIDMKLAATIGYFSEGYAIGWADDAEFHLRGRLSGLEALHVPSAVCVHASKDHGTRRSYGQFHNRYRLILTAYSARALVLLSVPLILFEIALTVLGLALGVTGERLEAIRHIWRDRADIRVARAAVQHRRRIRDSAVLQGGGVELGGPMRRSQAFRLLTDLTTGALDAYWRLVRRWL